MNACKTRTYWSLGTQPGRWQDLLASSSLRKSNCEVLSRVFSVLEPGTLLVRGSASEDHPPTACESLGTSRISMTTFKVANWKTCRVQTSMEVEGPAWKPAPRPPSGRLIGQGQNPSSMARLLMPIHTRYQRTDPAVLMRERASEGSGRGKGAPSVTLQRGGRRAFLGRPHTRPAPAGWEGASHFHESRDPAPAEDGMCGHVRLHAASFPSRPVFLA